MLTPLDEYPIHQTALPLAQPGGGHPDHYDRYWFSGFREDLYFAVALATYPNRGIIDAAFSVVRAGVQRSVFASGRMPLDQREIRIGPISIEIVEPFRINRVVVDAPSYRLRADMTFQARTAAVEEARQTRYEGTKLWMDSTRATQFGAWTGQITCNEEQINLGDCRTFGVKDRSWGIRSVGEPAPAAPALHAPQVFFLWAPLHFDDVALHGLVFEDELGKPWSQTAAALPVIGKNDPTWGAEPEVEHFSDMEHQVRWASGLRRSEGATLTFVRGSGVREVVNLTPLLTFRMRGAGYGHPRWKHGLWHGEFELGGESHSVEELDSLDPSCIHVQQVVRATWGSRVGIGVLEQAVIGPHAPSGFTEFLDGARVGPGFSP